MSVQKKWLCRDSLSLLSDLLTIVMGHFFLTTDEVGISFRNNRIHVSAMRWAMRQITYIFLCLVPVRIVFCVATCCCNHRFNETYFCYGVSFLVINPMDSAISGMINVRKLHWKLIATYLWSHQIQDALGHNAYSYMIYSLFLWDRKAFTMMVVHIASDAFVGTVAQAVTFCHMRK